MTEDSDLMLAAVWSFTETDTSPACQVLATWQDEWNDLAEKFEDA